MLIIIKYFQKSLIGLHYFILACFHFHCSCLYHKYPPCSVNVTVVLFQIVSNRFSNLNVMVRLSLCTTSEISSSQIPSVFNATGISSCFLAEVSILPTLHNLPTSSTYKGDLSLRNCGLLMTTTRSPIVYSCQAQVLCFLLSPLQYPYGFLSLC